MLSAASDFPNGIRNPPPNTRAAAQSPWFGLHLSWTRLSGFDTQDSVLRCRPAYDALAYGLSQPSGNWNCRPIAPNSMLLSVFRFSSIPLKNPSGISSCPYLTLPPSARSESQPFGSSLTCPFTANP